MSLRGKMKKRNSHFSLRVGESGSCNTPETESGQYQMHHWWIHRSSCHPTGHGSVSSEGFLSTHRTSDHGILLLRADADYESGLDRAFQCELLNVLHNPSELQVHVWFYVLPKPTMEVAPTNGITENNRYVQVCGHSSRGFCGCCIWKMLKSTECWSSFLLDCTVIHSLRGSACKTCRRKLPRTAACKQFFCEIHLSPICLEQQLSREWRKKSSSEGRPHTPWRFCLHELYPSANGYHLYLWAVPFERASGAREERGKFRVFSESQNCPLHRGTLSSSADFLEAADNKLLSSIWQRRTICSLFSGCFFTFIMIPKMKAL